MKNLRNILLGALAALAILFAPSFDDQKVEASTKVIASNDIQNVSQKYKGIRYKYGGTTTAGFDCSGYVQFVYKQLGVKLDRSTSAMYSKGTSVSKANLQVGDLVFFKTTAAKVGHVGIYIGNNKFIHSSTSKGVVVTDINDKYYWGKRYVGAKRVATVSTSVAKK
jgi:cell wall-associated NlpC family hydrolase